MESQGANTNKTKIFVKRGNTCGGKWFPLAQNFPLFLKIKFCTRENFVEEFKFVPELKKKNKAASETTSLKEDLQHCFNQRKSRKQPFRVTRGERR